MGLFDVKGVEETLNAVLGTTGLSGTMLCAVPWKGVFKEVREVVDPFNPLTPKTKDQYETSPYDINTLLARLVMRISKSINYRRLTYKRMYGSQ